MAAPPYPLSRVLDIIENFREAGGPGADPRLTLGRIFLHRPDARRGLGGSGSVHSSLRRRVGGIFRAQAGSPNAPLRRGGCHRVFADGSFDEVGRESSSCIDSRIALLAVEVQRRLTPRETFARSTISRGSSAAPAGRRSRAEDLGGGAMIDIAVNRGSAGGCHSLIAPASPRFTPRSKTRVAAAAAPPSAFGRERRYRRPAHPRCRQPRRCARAGSAPPLARTDRRSP